MCSSVVLSNIHVDVQSPELYLSCKIKLESHRRLLKPPSRACRPPLYFLFLRICLFWTFWNGIIQDVVFAGWLLSLHIRFLAYIRTSLLLFGLHSLRLRNIRLHGWPHCVSIQFTMDPWWLAPFGGCEECRYERHGCAHLSLRSRFQVFGCRPRSCNYRFFFFFAAAAAGTGSRSVSQAAVQWCGHSSPQPTPCALPDSCDPPTSASRVLGLQERATTLG